MLELINVSANRGGKEILADVSFSVAPGEILALIGKNGCGKSTLCECINGALRHSGEIFCDGKKLTRLGGKERAKLVAFLPQLLTRPHITVSELIAFGENRNNAFFSENTESEIDGVCELSERFLDELSGGELRRAYLAMTLARETPYIILDEPCANMDAAFTHSFMQSLIRMKREKSLLVVMHDINAAVRYADKIAILDGGKIAFSGDASASYEAIEAVFGIKKYTAGENVFFAP